MKTNVALVGAGGFGVHYLNTLFDPVSQQKINFVGVIDPYAEKSPLFSDIQQRNIPIYDDLTGFFAHNSAEIVCIASPIQFHMPHTLTCLENGANVLCEKPICATIQDALKMAQAEACADGFVAIGYQWSFSDAIQSLKHDVLTGVLGQPVRLKCQVYWPRPAAYYGRNSWAGKIQLGDGTWVLDSPVNNATAHYLHNMFFILDASLTSAQAELYRANPIENYDTAAVRCYTDQNVEILFYTTHACLNTINPIFDYEFENAHVIYQADDREADIIAHFNNGDTKNYGNPFATNTHKLWQCVDAIQNGGSIACTIKDATPLTRCINAIQESVPKIAAFPDHLINREGEQDNQLRWVTGLKDTLQACYEHNQLPAEMKAVDWAQVSRLVNLQDYDHFPMQTPAR